MPAFSAYPYLTTSLVLLVIAVLAVGAYAADRRLAVSAGWLSAPTAGYALAFVPQYWQPVQLLPISPGIEDVIFSLANGATSWVIATWPDRGLVRTHATGGQALGRYLTITALFIVMLLALRRLGTPVMPAGMLAAGVLFAWLLRRRPELWRFAVRGGIAFATLYTAVLAVAIAWWPHFLADWNHARLLGFRVLGMPVEEPAWALCFGAFWPLFVAYVLDIHVGGTAANTSGARRSVPIKGARG